MEFIAVVLDVGSHMYDGSDNDSSIILGINTIKGLIQKKLFAESKDEVAIIFCGSNLTNNTRNNDDTANYKHINISKSLKKVDWSFFENLNEDNANFRSDGGDLLEGIIVAADHLVTELRNRKEKGLKRVILISNLEGKTDFTQLDSVVDGLSKEAIELNIISDREVPGEADNGDQPSTSEGHRNTNYNDGKVSETKATNERNIAKLVSRLNGATYSFDDAFLSLGQFETKSLKQRAWKANLEISNVCHISVAGYIKVKAAQTLPLKLRYGGDIEADVVKRTTLHFADDHNSSVEVDDTIKGFRYGNSLVPFSEDDIKSMELSTIKSLNLIGFCEEDNILRHVYVGDSSMIFVADNPSSEGVFTSLVHAMYECGVVALVRRVYCKGSAPRLGSLSPVIKNEAVYFVYRELAFAEDIRSYNFPPLPTESTNLDCQSSTDTKKTISKEQLEAVDSFIDRLMLTKKNEDDDEETEVYKPSETVSPSIQMFYQSVSHKCLNRTGPLPKLNDRVMETLQPPTDNVRGLDRLVDTLKSMFPLKNKENHTKKKKFVTESISQDNGSVKKIRPDNDGDSRDFAVCDVPSFGITEVGFANPVEDFNSLLREGHTSMAIDGMQNIIWKLINDSYLDTLYPKAIVCLLELRKKMKEYSTQDDTMIARFNDFLKNMKSTLLQSSAKVGFWNLLKKDNINLIADSESDFGCSNDDTESFFETKDPPAPVTEMKEEDMDTLFEDM